MVLTVHLRCDPNLQITQIKLVQTGHLKLTMVSAHRRLLYLIQLTKPAQCGLDKYIVQIKPGTGSLDFHLDQILFWWILQISVLQHS